MRYLNEVCRAFYPDLHRCACQCPGLGTTIFFPGQKPLPDGHGVHSLPPPPRMYEPFWQGRHWPARGLALVREARRQAVLIKKQLRRVQRDHSATITPAHALSLTTAQLIEPAPFSLTKPKQVLSQRKNCKRQTQAPVPFTHIRLHEFSRGDDCARIGGGVPTKLLVQTRVPKNAGKQNTNASSMEQSHRQRRSCPRIANICGDAPCPLS